jgi:hypothetical protein
MDSAAQITLDELINSVMFSLEEDNTNYLKYFNIALKVIRDFHMHHMKGIRHEELELDLVNRVSLPSDCLRVIAIGVPYLGRLWQFTIDDKLLRNTSVSGGLEIRDSTQGELDVKNDESFGYDTKGGVNKWYYTIDYTDRKIIISGQTVSTITLHFISDGISLDSITYIPTTAQMALESAIIFYAQIRNPNITGDQKNRNEKIYKEEVIKYRRFNAPTFEEIRDTYLGTLQLTAKR